MLALLVFLFLFLLLRRGDNGRTVITVRRGIATGPAGIRNSHIGLNVRRGVTNMHCQRSICTYWSPPGTMYPGCANWYPYEFYDLVLDNFGT